MMPDDAPVGIADSDTIRVRISEEWMSRRFIVMLLHHAPYVQHRIQSVQRGAILSGLNTATIAGLRIAVPPKSEQDSLLQEIERGTNAIDRSMATIRYEISLLREYRTRLIADVVTGKLDVRNVKCEGRSVEGEKGRKSVGCEGGREEEVGWFEEGDADVENMNEDAEELTNDE
jgi:type I restriction enzyme S subunit